MKYVNGFAIGDSGRVVFKNAKPAYSWAGLPFTVDNVNAGEQGGQVLFRTARAGFDADGEAVYVDNAVKPIAGKVYFSGGTPKTDGGEIACDSQAPVWGYAPGGLPITADGYIAIEPTQAPAPPGKAVVYQAVATGLDVEFRFRIGSTLPAVNKWEARYINTAAGIDNTVDITSTAIVVTGGYLVRAELKPAGDWTIAVRATNTLGVGAWSDPFAVKTIADPSVPTQLKVTPAVDMTIVELSEAVLAGGKVDYYSASILDKTYGFRLSDRLMAWEPVSAGVVRVRIPSKVGPADAWMTTDTGWDVSYIAVGDAGQKSDRSKDVENPTMISAATTANPLKANVTSATGDLNTFTVNFAPGAGETATINGWFIGVGASTGNDTDYVWTFVANGAARTYTGKAYKADDNYGVCVRAYSNTGGMSDEGSFAEITP
jgi:hypothetical protein